MTFEKDKHGERRPHGAGPVDRANGTERGSDSRKRKSKENGNPEVGVALRSFYDNTLREDVPSDMLNLLGKLD